MIATIKGVNSSKKLIFLYFRLELLGTEI
jgi:hypothetical protein